MAKKFVIVEDNNDKYTFEAILRYMETSDIEVKSTEKEDIDWYIRSAESNIDSPTGLKDSLFSAFKELRKEEHDKIGIIWDLDNFTNEQRLLQINNALKLAVADFQKENIGVTITFDKIEATNTFAKITINDVDAEIACHFVQYKGVGELEDLLKAIKAKNSDIADCIDAKLPECLDEKEETSLRNKDLVKLWINHYQRYDTLPKKNRKDAFTRWDNMMKNRSDIFDFGKDEVIELKELKAFLKQLIIN